MLTADHSPDRASPDQKYNSVQETALSSPLTSPSPTPVSAAPRFARKNAYLYGAPTRAPGKKLALTSSCTDDNSLPDSTAEKNEESEPIMQLGHRYKTRSKLASMHEFGELSHLKMLKRDPIDECDTDSRKDSKTARQGDEIATESNVRTSFESKAKPDPFPSSSTYRELVSTSTRSGALIRTFPSHVPYHPYFPLFYRRFPNASSSAYVCFILLLAPLVITRSRIVRPNIDLYTPHFTRGSGPSKTGLCPICSESVENGGEGRKVWLAMKCSAYKW